jgi:chromosome partitioning protein
MKRFTVINMKGGCGKTTIATNLASAYANRGRNTTLIDYLDKCPTG